MISKTWQQRLRNILGWVEVGDVFFVNGKWYRVTYLDPAYGYHGTEACKHPVDEVLEKGAKLIEELSK